jgi:hypothetical protein
MQMKIDAPMKNKKSDAEATVRCLSTEIGRVALSPLLNWMIINIMTIKPKPTKRPIIRELFHA